LPALVNTDENAFEFPSKNGGGTLFYVAFCVVLAAALQLIDHVYHRRDLSFLATLPVNTPIREFRRKLATLERGRFDNLFAVAPFLWSWLLITAAVLLFGRTDSLIVKCALVLFVAGRFRSLQEAGHFAVHGCLCQNMKLALLLANIFYQYPAFMPEAGIRRDIHVRRHHHSVNMPHDPDLKEMLDRNFRPGISRLQFWTGVFHPLTPKGIQARFVECAVNVWADRQKPCIIVRLCVILLVSMTFIHFDLNQEFLFLYVLPVLVIYPNTT
jgi:fatty acid desaturase